jgi:hypothetical protein
LRWCSGQRSGVNCDEQRDPDGGSGR